jgi:hypothetical protein
MRAVIDGDGPEVARLQDDRRRRDCPDRRFLAVLRRAGAEPLVLRGERRVALARRLRLRRDERHRE